MSKTKTCLVRLSDDDNLILDAKATLLGTNKSALLRDGAFTFWSKSKDNHSTQLLKLYKDGDERQKSLIVDLIFEHYRRHGYPYAKLSSHDLIEEIKRISKTKNPLLEDNHLQTNTIGLKAANHFHPHMVKVRCLSRYKSPWELYNDDVAFKDAINRWMEIGHKPNPAGIRRILRSRDGTRSVVNFKPAIAKYFYDNYVPVGGEILDPCAGYGGRLIGCIASNRNLNYFGIDPHGPTAVGNMKMASFYGSQYDSFQNREWKFSFSFELGCAEDVMLKLPSDKYDLVFSSPPYWRTEQYSNLPDQSWIRHGSIYEKWKNDFLFVMLRESCRVVKSGGYVIYNMKNYEKIRIADDLADFLRQSGLKHVKDYSMRMSNSEYRRGVNFEQKWHTEPIFVFQKN